MIWRAWTVAPLYIFLHNKHPHLIKNSSYIAMIELEKGSPSFEMLERIAAALNVDPPDLFSKKVYSIDLIKDFHDAVLSDFENVLKKQINNFEKKTGNA